ncbi:MAG: hypothetical protein EKK53_04770 [Burkholderiales bacterium]|nr:MAG: hypothetical protein EKK53_04770 [Burkholderiales bacterium]
MSLMTTTQGPDAIAHATAELVQGDGGWRFERIDARSISVKSPTFTLPFVVSLDSPGSCQRAFYNLAADVLDSASARHAAGASDTGGALAALRAVLATDVAAQVFHRLEEGQGTDTDDGRAWTRARAVAAPLQAMLGGGVDMPKFPMLREIQS